MPYVQGGTSQSKSGRPEVVDVWHSSNVYANHVPVALWLDAQGTEAAVLAAINAPEYSVDAATIAFDGSEDEAGVDAQQQKLVAAGIVSQAELDKGKNAVYAATQINSTPSVSTATLDSSVIAVSGTVDDILLYDSPNTGIKYYVKTVTKRPGVVFPYDVATIAPQNGFKVDDVVNNLRCMVINCFDPIKKQFPDAFMTCSFRADLGYARSPHKNGSACDIQYSKATKAEYYTRALWIKDNVLFDQFLLEYKTTGTKKPWHHLGINRDGNNRKQVCTFMNDKNCKAPGVTGLYDLTNVE